MEVVRSELSSRLAASLANALLKDLNEMKLLNLPIGIKLETLLFDKSKIDRSKLKVKSISSEHEDKIKKKFLCIGADGRSDKKTKTFEENINHEGIMKQKQITKDEHHITFTYENCEDNGVYLTHRTIPSEGSTGELQAHETYKVLEEYDSLSTLKAVLLDNTATNTGYKSGLVVKLEQILERKLHTVGCMLHWNELPMRAVFKSIDGESTGPTTFSGTIGKQAVIDQHDKPQVKFEPIITCMIELPPDVVQDLSTDQRMLYEYTLGISEGKIDPVWASRKCGPLNHARWLTLAIRVIMIYTRSIKPSLKLIRLVKFVVKIYSQSWFRIKGASSLAEAPAIVFELISRLKDLNDTAITKVVKKNIQNNSFCLLSDNFIYSLVCSQDFQIRDLGLEAIQRIRSEGRTFALEPAKKIPTINFDASCWSGLIDLKDVSVLREPAVTTDLTDSDIESHRANFTKPQLPNLPIHSQSVERAVKLVTEASEKFVGYESRHRAILTKVLSRKCRPNFESKGKYEESYSDLF